MVEQGELSASLFRFTSGVQALRLRNSAGELVLLSFQGQQIWDANMCGRRLTMKSMFDQPYPTREFLSTFGGFLLHCGATAIGSPSPLDTHPLHGELPNAPYSQTALVMGADANGEFIGLTGQYRHTVAFNYHYLAMPLVKLYTGSSVFAVSMTIQNLKASDMPLMFLERINFRPVDRGRLVQSAACDRENIRVRANLSLAMDGPTGYRELVERLQEYPQDHLVFTPGLMYNPEIVLYLNYQACKDGWARTMQVHPDGSTDLVRHRPNQLNHSSRWLCRTADQDAFGVEPYTAELEGYLSEREKGNVLTLKGGEKFTAEFEIGVLEPPAAQLEEEMIATSVAGKSQ